jgi:hypothetical protein
VHYPNQAIKEEAAALLLTCSSEFEEANSLLELQKINTQKTNFDEFKVNFREEPAKSQK